MTNKIFKPVSYVLILAIGLTMTFTSCEKTPEPMDLPPKESLTISLDAFPESSTKSASGPVFHWAYSVLNIAGWNLVIAANVVIPVAAYAEAFNHTPVYLGDNTWEWSYSITQGVHTYVASLIGERLNNEEFSMEMYLSKSGVNPFDEVMWFSGVVRYDHTEASWKMNMDPYNLRPFMDIDYHKDFEAGTADIRYTSTDPQNAVYEGFIEYGIDPEFEYDAYYTIQRAMNDVTEIEWNMTSAAGRVRDQVHYLDANWHCWDTMLADVDCTE
jgi:hypothetical protein